MASEEQGKTPMGGVSAFNCRSCGGQVTLLAPGQTLAAACQHCGAVADLTDPNFRVLTRYLDAVPHPPRYDIGTKATFEGKTWVVIGFMVRIVRLYEFEWEEYLLFNPYHGFRFLAHAYGHWSWIKMVTDGPLTRGNATQVTYQGKDFKKLTEGEAEVTFVLGEFYWQVKVGDKAATRDFVAPPYLLSVEYESGGMIWSVGEYLDPIVVEKAMGGPPRNKMARIGVGAAQPNRYAEAFRRIRLPWILSMVAAIAITVLFGRMSANKVVHEKGYTYPSAVDVVSEPFELEGGVNNVEIDLTANSGLDNHWVEVSGVLHNLETNANYEFTVGAEYYYGVSEGERWSEGSTLGEVTLNEVPGGNYEMVLASESDSTGGVTLQVRRGVPIFSNVLLVLSLLSILPIFVYAIGKSIEKQRYA